MEDSKKRWAPVAGPMVAGPRLSPDEAAAVERTLTIVPDDLDSHLELIAYYASRLEAKDDIGNSRAGWAKHIYWLIDRHPESAAFEFPFSIATIVGPTGGPSPSAEVSEESRHRWERAVAAHPNDKDVLAHAAAAVGLIDKNLALPLARRIVELDPTCSQCRFHLGALYAFAIMRWREESANGVTCSPITPATGQTVAQLRSEIAASSDAEALVGAGTTLQGYSGSYQSYCHGIAQDVIDLGQTLVEKAVGIDPSIIDRYHPQRRVDTKSVSNAGGGALPGAVMIGEEDAKKQLMHREEAVYPVLAKELRLQDTVTLRITVDIHGAVTEATLVSGHPLLIGSAIEAVRRYRYAPFLAGGKPHPFQTIVRVRFTPF